MEEKDLEKMLELRALTGGVMTDHEILIINTVLKILETRKRSVNPTEKLSMELCLDAITILIEVISQLTEKQEEYI